MGLKVEEQVPSVGAAARPRVLTRGSRARVSSLWKLSQDLQKGLPGTEEGTCQARAGTVGKGAALALNWPHSLPFSPFPGWFSHCGDSAYRICMGDGRDPE